MDPKLQQLRQQIQSIHWPVTPGFIWVFRGGHWVEASMEKEAERWEEIMKNEQLTGNLEKYLKKDELKRKSGAEAEEHRKALKAKKEVEAQAPQAKRDARQRGDDDWESAERRLLRSLMG